MPDTSPVPIEWSYSGLPGSGTVVFDRDLDTSVPLDPADWSWGTGGQTRNAQGVAYSGSRTVVITQLAVATAPPLVGGWRYQIGDNPIRGTDGAQVAPFIGFKPPPALRRGTRVVARSPLGLQPTRSPGRLPPSS